MSQIFEGARSRNHLWSKSAPLGPSERAEIAAAVSQLVPNWSVELSPGLSPPESIMISPDDGEDASGPTVIITAESGVFRLDAFRWDSYWSIGEYRTWAEAVCETRKVVAWEGAIQKTLH